MTITKTVASKLAVAFVAIAMAFVFVAPAANAQSIEDMSLEELIALVNQLQSQMTQSTSGGSCDTIPQPLTVGAQNANVTSLQTFLIAEGEVIPAGATGYFGSQTQAALASWQAKNGISPAAGYYGPITKAAIDAKCVSAGGDDMDDDDDSSSDDDDELKGGETDINSMQGRDEDDEAAEGEEDVPVHRVEFDVEDADAMLKRVDVTFDNSSIGDDGEADPWDAFEEISIWVDGDEVAREDVTDEDDWDEDGDEYTFRINGVDTIFREDDSAEVIIAVSVQNGVDVDGDAGQDDWDVFVGTSGMRFVDGEGVDTEDGPGSGDASTFEIIEEGENDDLDLESSDEDPDATTLEIDSDDKVEHAIFAFELNAEDSDNDVTLDNLVSVDVLVGGTEGTSLNNFIHDFRLEIDGESFDAESYTGTNATATIDFDIDGDVTIDAEDSVVVMLYAEFDDVGDSFSFATISASTTSSYIDAEGADDITMTVTSVLGNVHTVRTDGLAVELVSEDTELDENSDTTSADDEGEFTLKVDVTAFGDDAYIPFGATTTTDNAYGFELTILDNSNNPVTVGGGNGTTTISVDVDDGSAEKDSSYKVAKGTTETFTIVMKFDPATAGSYKVRLDTVNFGAADDATGETAQDVSDEDIDTAKLTI